ncbi:MAG: 3-hydroxyacyl-CoA dehydrogenase NAD-binding domain-containing protein [Leptospirillia bacterium]
MSTRQFWSFEEDGGIGTLTLDVPDKAVNVLSSEVLEELSGVLDELAGKSLTGLVVCSAKRGFIAGADVNEIAEIVDPTTSTALVSRGQQVLIQLEKLKYPTVAAIHGVCLGGGMELALACTHRVVSDDPSTKMGLPEVKLGIHPGFGGCVRLPKIVGLERACDWILTGKTVNARQARRAGLVAQVAPAERLLEVARKQVGTSKKVKGKGNLVGWLLTRNPVGRTVFFDQAFKRLKGKVSPDHYPAPFAALGVLRDIAGKSSAAAHRIEAESCGGLIPLKSTKNLIRVFFASEKLKHQDAVRLGKADADAIRQVAVVGAGVMGAGIAGEMARGGLLVRFADISDKAMEKGLKIISKTLKRSTRNAPRGEYERAMGRILPTLDLDRLGAVDALVEAVPERMDFKKSLFERALPQVKDGALILSNTSSLSVTDMFADTPDPGRTAGMHFFNPVPRMPLVEVVVGEKTSPETVARVAALSVRIGKMPLIVQECPGFLVNRILMPYLNEAVLMMEEGAGIDEVDRVLKEFGMPMGAFRLIDEIGMDVCHHVAGVLEEGFGARMAPAASMRKFYEAGRYGKKSDKGFYRYQDGKGVGEDPDAYALVDGRGSTRFSDEDIRDRLVLSMVSEAARILAEGVVESPQMLDAGMVFGTGFPPFRGGLMRYVEERGVGQVLAILERFADKYGERFSPNDWLRDFTQGE